MTIREKVARAICQGNPDMCVSGSGGTSDAPMVCHQRAWELHIGGATAAINAVLAAAAEEGWHMRPDEATEEMIEAIMKGTEKFEPGMVQFCRQYKGKDYVAMLAAAPEWKTGVQHVGKDDKAIKAAMGEEMFDVFDVFDVFEWDK